MSKTAVTSFIIRFKQEMPGSHPPLPWHGRIRHVQTSQERHFTTISEAVEFMADYVEITPVEETDQESDL